MPGEENQPQPELLVFDLGTKAKVKIKADRFKDQTISVSTAPREKPSTASGTIRPRPMWLSDTSDKLYFGRQSRDLHRYDVCLADTKTGEVKVLIQEVLNTYVDVQPLRLINGGKEMIWWSERDGWGHYYLYDGNGKLKNQITAGEFADAGDRRTSTKKHGSSTSKPAAARPRKIRISCISTGSISTARA